MKTCNGCERLVQKVEISWKGKDYLVDMCQTENTNSILLTGRMVIGRHNKTIETPEWCPKEEKMCNNHSINVQKEDLNVN